MAPPLATPSPHRFVVKKEPPARRFAPSQQPQFQSTPRPSTQQQFNTTPRFNFSSTPRPTATQRLPLTTPSAARYLTPAPKQRDAIIEDDDFPSDVHDSIETDGHDINDNDHEFSDDGEDYAIDNRSTKRRRLSVSSIISHDEDEDQDMLLEGQRDVPEELGTSSSLPILSSPTVPTPKRIHSMAPRFLPPTPHPPSTPFPSTGTTIFQKAPSFRPPDPAEQAKAGHDPLPEHFSPMRKGQKLILDGLAAQLSGWLVNLDSAVPIRPRNTITSEWLVRLLVDEVSGGLRTGFTMVKGRQIHDVDDEGGMGMVDTVGEVKVLLAGEAQVEGLAKGRQLEVGRRVGIKGPVWEVIVEGEKWGVGVNWKILN